MTEWVETPLGSLCKFQAGDAFPKEKQGIAAGEYPFIKVSDMNLPGNERFIQRSNNWIQKADASKYRLHPPGAVVFAKIGEALRANRRRVLVRETIIDNNMMSAVPKGGINPSFLLYVLEGIDFNNISRGSALPYLAAGDLNKLTVSIPGKEVQQAIAETLSLLDQKIELNRRMNETLEGMAQAIFRDWFVDFGPTRRKVAGEADPVAIMGGLTPDPARAAELAALFPAALGDDGLPEGWHEGTLDRLAKAAGETVNPTTISSETPYIGLEHMPRQCIALSEWGIAGSVSSNKTRFSKGQVLFGKLRPYFHKVGIAPIDGVSSTDIVVLDSNRLTDRPFVSSCVSTESFVAFTNQNSTGTKMPRTGWGQMRTYPIALAPERVRDGFATIVQPMYNKIVAAIHENRTFAEARDYLLPRLMSGAVRILPQLNEVGH